MTKVTFVTPWYGLDIPGGAETAARQTVEKLHQAGLDVEVLTTTIKDFYADWGSNAYKAGTYQINGVTVQRFPVEKRNKQAFDTINWRLIHNLPITKEQEQVFINEMIKVPKLYEFIAQHGDDRLFIFIPYMFATTYHGAKIHPERSLMIPCLHDESYAKLSIYQEVLPYVKGLVLFVDAELTLVESLFGATNDQLRVVMGLGIDTEFEADADRFRQKHQLDKPFILYAGRREVGKNTPLLIDYWQRYQQDSKRDALLVLIGSGSLNISQAMQEDHKILDLGFVSLQDKYDAFAAASMFCMPSVNESFSIVIMESWLRSTPVLVNGRCVVTREHCQHSNGGLYFSNYEEFAATVDYILDNPVIAQQMGQNGRQYVLDNYQWPTIIDKYRQMIDLITEG